MRELATWLWFSEIKLSRLTSGSQEELILPSAISRRRPNFFCSYIFWGIYYENTWSLTISGPRWLWSSERCTPTRRPTVAGLWTPSWRTPPSTASGRTASRWWRTGSLTWGSVWGRGWRSSVLPGTGATSAVRLECSVTPGSVRPSQSGSSGGKHSI